MYIPPGTYRVTAPLVFDVSEIRGVGARICGAGQSTIIDLTAVTSGTAWSVVNTNKSPGAFYYYNPGSPDPGFNTVAQRREAAGKYPFGRARGGR